MCESNNKNAESIYMIQSEFSRACCW